MSLHGGFSGKKEEKKIPHKMFPFTEEGGQQEEQRHKKRRKEITGKWDNFSKHKGESFFNVLFMWQLKAA